jgi:hypothetical protein
MGGWPTSADCRKGRWFWIENRNNNGLSRKTEKGTAMKQRAMRGWAVALMLAGGCAPTASHGPQKATEASAGARLYVSPSGDDVHPGTRGKPFATPTRARDEIRKRKAAQGGLPAGGVTVEIAGGRYGLKEPFSLSAEDSGTAAAPIVYRCAPEARAWLFGGLDVPVASLSPLSDAALRVRLPAEAAKHVRCLDLNRLGVPYYRRLPDRFNCYTMARGRCSEALGYKAEYGYKPGEWTPLEVFCDGQALTPARWPNEGFVQIDEVLDDGDGSSFEGVIARGGTFAQPSLKEKLKLWAGADDLILYGYFFRDYFGFSVRVAKIDLARSTVTLSQGVMDKKNKPHQRFYVQHLPEELDVPGEWVLKRDTGSLCLWPPKDAQTLTLPILKDPMIRLSDVAFVTVRGLGLEGGRGDGVEITGGLSNRIEACEIRNVGGNGVTVRNGAGHRVAGCDIHHTGRGGIYLIGGDRGTLTPAAHVAENNHIHHTSRLVRNYTVPILLSGVGNRASRNLIHDTPHIAVQFTGNEHVMELNEIFSVLEETNEAGIFYTGRDWTARGNVIRYNFIHHATGVPSWGVRFVHLDDLASGTEIYGNICYKLEDGIAICGGNENKVHDNLFVQCKETINLGPRDIDMFKSDGKGGFELTDPKGNGNTIAKNLRQYKWYEPPYSTKYPKLTEIFRKTPIAAPWWNEVERNLAVDCDKHIAATPKSAEWECVVRDNWTGDDPGFVEPDHTKLDFRLKPDALAYAQIGFHPIPYDRVGVYASPERAAWPVVCQRPAADWMPRWMMSREALNKTPVAIFPVADIKKGRTIMIDGAVNDEEWSPPGYDGNEPDRHVAALIGYRLDGTQDARPATAYVESDGDALCVACTVDLAPGESASRGHRWGKDDAIEIALAVAAPPETMPGQERSFVFRGYANGHLEGSTESGWSEYEVSRSVGDVRFAAKATSGKGWTAEFRIPFACFGYAKPEGGNRPVLANLTVFRSASKQWLQWRKPAGPSWKVPGGRALWIKPFGPLAYLPGCRSSLAAVHIKLEGQVPAHSLVPEEGVSVPEWVKDGNRLVGDFGTVRGDQWRTFRLRFTPKVDASAFLLLMGAEDAWTYYDAFEAEGTDVSNPDFEEVRDGKSPGWSVDAAKGAGIVRPSDGAASGLWAARAKSDARVSRTLRLTKGVPVTVTFKARAALPLAPE